MKYIPNFMKWGHYRTMLKDGTIVQLTEIFLTGTVHQTAPSTFFFFNFCFLLSAHHELLLRSPRNPASWAREAMTEPKAKASHALISATTIHYGNQVEGCLSRGNPCNLSHDSHFTRLQQDFDCLRNTEP